MLETYIRPIFQKVCVTPVTNYCYRKGFYASQVTAAGLVLGVMTLPLLYLHWVWLAALSLILSGFCDVLDGSLARLSQQSSPLGTVFDIMSDRIVELAVIIGLYSMAPETRALGALLMLGSVFLCVTSFLVVGIFSENTTQKSFHYSPGLIERAEAFIFFLLIMFLPQYFYWFAVSFTLLVLLTTAIRLWEFQRQQLLVNKEIL